MTDRLDRLCRHFGIARDLELPDGTRRPVPEATRRTIVEALGADAESAPEAPRRMEVPPEARCYLPQTLRAHPGWGVFCQLYELRSSRNWGIGDFADLAELARICGGAGADFLGINPVHALFLADPGRRSPFAPSNRRFLNPLYIAPDRVPGHRGGAPDALDELRATDLVDYHAVADVKIAALRRLFHEAPFGEAGAADFDRFVARKGEPLRLHALFEVISARMVAEGRGAGWRDWPEELQDPRGEEVDRIAEQNADELRFQLWLQWVAERQITEAAQAARDAGMRVGLYLDLAVGEAPDGSSTWSGAAAALPGLTVGAPPDLFATEGQNWGLSAPNPAKLEATDFAPFREMIAAQLAHAGALRIDHAMALWQLFLVPEGRSPLEGAHLRFPFPDLLRELSALSRAHEAVVIGEDLGHVPPGFRAAMDEADILSYRILYFEQTERGFNPPDSYPEKALACLSTHDLPVLAAWWRGEDVDLRRRFGMVDEARSDQDAAHRAHERATLLRELRTAGVLKGHPDPGAEALPPPVRDAAHRFIARTPSLLAGVRLADLVGPETPTNLPGTMDEHPNWRPKSPTALSEIAAHPAFAGTAALMREERPRPGAPT